MELHCGRRLLGPQGKKGMERGPDAALILLLGIQADLIQWSFTRRTSRPNRNARAEPVAVKARAAADPGGVDGDGGGAHNRERSIGTTAGSEHQRRPTSRPRHS
jgi:hypothetical protein